MNEDLSAIGRKYRDGKSVEHDSQKASEYFQRAFENAPFGINDL